MKDQGAKEITRTIVVAVFLLSSIALNLQLMRLDNGGMAGAELDSGGLQDVVEARIVETDPCSYLPFLVEYSDGGQLAQAWCKASLKAEELYRDGAMGVGDPVIAAVDPETRTGVVIDSILVEPLEEPTEPTDEPQPTEPEQPEEPAPEPEPEPKPGPEEGGEEPTTEPEEPEPAVELPDGFELVSSEPRPTPGVEAPEGKVKLTVMTQPTALPGVAVYPPPGVYFVNVYSVVTFSCVSENPDWEFSNWTISRGALGVRYKSGVGYEHLLRWRVDVDTVVTAYHTELI
jgi:hypothetical protein